MRNMNTMSWPAGMVARDRVAPYGGASRLHTCPAIAGVVGENSVLFRNAKGMDAPGTPAWRPPDW